MAESKISPLLVSGSWVGCLMNKLTTMLPSRFRHEYLDNMPEDEAVEMVFNYSEFFGVSVTEESAWLQVRMTEGSPFYISPVMRSSFKGKDLTSIAGLTGALQFEILDNRGAIKSNWIEYVKTAFSRVNNRNAKRIVLHLCKNCDWELTRREIIDDLKLDIPDEALEKKLEALVRAGIISQGQTNFDYRSLQDNIFDKVFRGVYEKEIRHFDVKEIGTELTAKFSELQTMYFSLLGKYNYQKGLFLEYVLGDQLRLHARDRNELLKSLTRNLPGDFNFCRYDHVWRYDKWPEHAQGFNADIFARAADPGDYSLVMEIKNRAVRKFSI